MYMSLPLLLLTIYLFIGLLTAALHFRRMNAFLQGEPLDEEEYLNQLEMRFYVEQAAKHPRWKRQMWIGLTLFWLPLLIEDRSTGKGKKASGKAKLTVLRNDQKNGVNDATRGD